MTRATRSSEADPPPELGTVARTVLYISGAGIVTMSVAVLVGAWKTGTAEYGQTSQMVFNSLLPLFGTWVGTVLAYYFSRKNFESASNSVRDMVDLTLEQKLGRLKVQREMMRLGEITVHRMPKDTNESDVLLKDLRARLGGRITRVPVVDANGVVKYIVHQSSLYKFLADAALGKPGAELEKLTLQDMASDAQIKGWITAIAYIPETASVAEAKARMEDDPRFQDLIVTASGRNDEPMLGWLTNVDIGRLSKA
jgi:hypothetical protein